MPSEFLTQADVLGMPEDPRQRFVEIEALCRKRHADEVRGEQEWSTVVDSRIVYMSTVLSAAKHLRIEPFDGMDMPRKRSFQDDAFDDFIQDIQFYVTQMVLEAAEAHSRTSIVLEGATRQRLQTLVAHLKDQVGKSDCQRARKTSCARRSPRSRRN